ncbi:unnamed protein product [Prorocentrum cordatum]|uniref:HTH OST-type domain-containing protein n=1 Tax=Prorocentrum cordatum TaxID=2364126 RepID=A0ABN9QAW4_9DINO|nr:unnamed protein product [Polarella glacialis]
MAGSQSKNLVGGVCFKPTAAQVVAAVESLYADKLKPFGRILLKRVGEHAADITAANALNGKTTYGYVSIDEGHIPRIDPKHLMRTCRQCPQLRVEFLDSGEYAAMLVGCPPTFVDPGSDPYPPELWVDLIVYFNGLADSHPPLPGGRYNSARALKARDLPFLEGRSLGEVCHILALAVSQKKILGHFKGHTVPYARSENGHKEFCASAELPVCTTKLATAGMPVATWEQAYQGLQDRLLAESASKGAHGIPMPNVKRLFRSRLGLELSETALGHSRVQDLLQDERLHGICEVRRQGVNNNYVVVRQSAEVLPPPGILGHCAVPLHEAEPTYVQPSSLSGGSWPGSGEPQPAYITPTLLESIPLDAKWASDEWPLRSGRSGFYGLDPEWASGPFGLEVDLTPWDSAEPGYAMGPPGLEGYGFGRGLACAAYAA